MEEENGEKSAVGNGEEMRKCGKEKGAEGRKSGKERKRRMENGAKLRKEGRDARVEKAVLVL